MNALSASLKENDLSFVDAPETIVSQIGNPKLAIGVDLETHGWPDCSSSKGHVGQYGFYTMKDDASLKFARIVQIGWVVGECRMDAETSAKSYLVRPDGFEIQQRAVDFHKISNERAGTEGVSLKEALSAFMEDAVAAYDGGGKIVAHQIEWDGGVIYEELGRCGLTALQSKWASMITTAGFCTMAPHIGRWLLRCCGKEVGPSTGTAHYSFERASKHAPSRGKAKGKRT